MRNIVNEIEAHLIDKCCDVLCFSEHWLTENEIEIYNLDNYTLGSYYCRKSLIHGGVAIFTKQNLKCINLVNINGLSIEYHCETTAIFIVDFNTIILNLYRSPSANFDIFINNLTKILLLLDFTKNIIICGDFNVKFNLNDKESMQLTDLMETFDLHSCVNFSTRFNNQLDNIFHNCHHTKVRTNKVITCLSDHDGIEALFSFPKHCNKTTEKVISYRPLTLENNFKFYHTLEKVNWGYLHEISNPSEAFHHFHTIFCDIFKYSFPLKHVKSQAGPTKKKVRWFTKELKGLRSLVYKHELEYKNKPCADNYIAKNNIRLLYRNRIKEEKIKANSMFIKTSNNICKATWALINELRNKNSHPVMTTSISADDFNFYFINIPTNIKKSLPENNTSPLSYMNNITSSAASNSLQPFSFQPVTFIEIRDIIDSLKNSNSKDAYELNTSTVKSVKDIIIIPLTNAINRCIESNTFPDFLKLAKVIPIHKKGDMEDPNNYRPISILPIFSKIYEKVLSKQIAAYFESNNLFNISQFGYRSNLSTVDAMMSLVTEIIECLEDREFSFSTFLDLTKAFDCMSHSILLEKLIKYNFSRASCSLIDSYLSNRKQFVYVNDNTSSLLPISQGVPQGSILGPLLFLIYINDLPTVISNKTILYVDDTNIVNRSPSFSDLFNQSNSSICNINKWFLANELSSNPTKTQQLLISNRTHSFKNPPSITFLGIQIDPRLKWDEHVSTLSKKICKTIFLLRNMSKAVSRDVLLTTYFALCHSHIAYALLIWGHSSPAMRIFGLQRRAVRIVAGLRYTEDCKPAFINLKIMTLPSLFIFQCLVYAHRNKNKWTSGMATHSHATRSQNKLQINYLRLSKSRHACNYYTIIFYNLLPHEYKVLCFPKFKEKVKKMLLANPFYSLNEFMNFTIS